MEPLLPRGVPDGEVDRSLSDLHLLVHEGGLQHSVGGSQVSFSVPGEQRGGENLI